MLTINKKWLSVLAGCAFVFQSAIVSANIIPDYQLEFSEVDVVSYGESFDVDVLLDIPLGFEVTGFGFDFDNSFSKLSFDGFSVANWIEKDDLFNDVGGIFGFFGPDGDNTYLATLHFTAVDGGIENVSTFGEVYFYDNFSGDEIYGTIGGAFDVKVPAPASLAFMLIGAAGLVRMRASKKS